MKVKIIRDTVAGGDFVSKGDVIELPNSEARKLIILKKAIAHNEVVKVDPETSPRIAESPSRKLGRPSKKIES